MVRARDVKRLVRAHIDRDEVMFRAGITAIRANEKSAGRINVAAEFDTLLRALERNTINSGGPESIEIPKDMKPFVTVSEPSAESLPELILFDELDETFLSWCNEQKFENELLAAGVPTSRKVLLHGPPGTGKTLTAQWTAARLQLPLVRVHSHALIGSVLGESAKNVATLFAGMRGLPAVYLFDECEVLFQGRVFGGQAADRSFAHTTTTLLQQIESDLPDAYILCATNCADHLDRAFIRRFDASWQFHLPCPAAFDSIMRRFPMLDIGEIHTEGVHSLADGLSHAEFVRACQSAIRNSIVNQLDDAGLAEAFWWALRDRKSMQRLVKTA